MLVWRSEDSWVESVSPCHPSLSWHLHGECLYLPSHLTSQLSDLNEQRTCSGPTPGVCWSSSCWGSVSEQAFCREATQGTGAVEAAGRGCWWRSWQCKIQTWRPARAWCQGHYLPLLPAQLACWGDVATPFCALCCYSASFRGHNTHLTMKGNRFKGTETINVYFSWVWRLED